MIPKATSLGQLRELNAELLKHGIAYYVNQEQKGSIIPGGVPRGWLEPKGELCLTVDIAAGGLSMPPTLFKQRTAADLVVSHEGHTHSEAVSHAGHTHGEKEEGLLFHGLNEVPQRDYEAWMGSEAGVRKHPHVLLLPYYERGDDVYIVGGHVCQRRLPWNNVFPLSTATMDGMAWPVPRFAHEALAQMFGPGYRNKDRINQPDDELHRSYCLENDL